MIVFQSRLSRETKKRRPVNVTLIPQSNKKTGHHAITNERLPPVKAGKQVKTQAKKELRTQRLNS